MGRTANFAAMLVAVYSIAAIARPVAAADVSAERLLNAPSDPQNWLMVHRDYNNSRHSPLKEINRDTVKDLKLKFLLSIGGTGSGKELVLVGESTGGSMGTRSWAGAFDANTGALVWRTFTIPAPGEPGSETWKDKHNAWRIGGASVWQTASFDPDSNLIYYGTGDAFPTYDPEFRPGDNLYTASTLAFDADTGKIAWYFQETPNEHWDFDTPSPKMLYEVTLNGERRKVVANFSRNGFFYSLDRTSGQFLRADQYQATITWTKG